MCSCLLVVSWSEVLKPSNTIILLYLLLEAIHRLENLIRENPVRFMTDPIIFNLWYVHVFHLVYGYDLLTTISISYFLCF